MDDFWLAISGYHNLNDHSKNEIKQLIREVSVLKNTVYLHEGETPKNVAFIKKGLLSYFYIDQKGNKIIKRFFTEGSFVASSSALITKSPGCFTIEAIEDTTLYQFNFEAFMKLVNDNHNIALLYIKYLEKNWIVEKEPHEIKLKQETAKERYINFTDKYDKLAERLKLHHIASFLAVTPTQLSRIRAEL